MVIDPGFMIEMDERGRIHFDNDGWPRDDITRLQLGAVINHRRLHFAVHIEFVIPQLRLGWVAIPAAVSA